MEHFLTCSCIRKKMDEDEQGRLEKGEGGLEKDAKNVRETLFVCARVFGGCAGCCCFAPFAIACYWGAIFMIADKRDIAISESMYVTAHIWLTGYLSGAVYSIFWCAASFYYQVKYKGAKFEAVSAERSKEVMAAPPIMGEM